MRRFFTYRCGTFLLSLLVCIATSVRAADSDVLDRIIFMPKSKGTVYTLLNMVSEQAGYLFIYDSKVVDNEHIVRLKEGSRSVRQAIYEIIGTQRVLLRIVGKHILINSPEPEKPEIPHVSDTLSFFTLEGSLLDKNTGAPVAYSTVGVVGTSIGSITNRDGGFRLRLPDSLSRHRIAFSHVGYVAQEVDIPLLRENHATLSLEPKVIPIQEVVIRVANPIRLLREMLDRREVNYPQKPIYLTTFYREGIRYKQKFRSLTEAVFKIYKSPIQPLRSSEQVKLLKMSRITNRNEQDTLITKFRGGIEACLQLDLMNHLPEFLTPDSRDNVYTYASTDVTVIDNRLANVISFEQKKGIKEPLYCGELYIDADNGALLQARVSIHPDFVRQAGGMIIERQARSMKITLQQVNYTISYKPWNGTYYISHVRGDLHFKVKRKRQWLGSSPLHTWFEMVTCKIDTVEVNRFQRNERIPTRTVFADTRFKYDPEFWEEFNVIPWEEGLVKVIEQLSFKLEKIEYDSLIE
ncbi:carboxypeptidase-like regulatory domain-containing protein [Phocaeicola sp.]